MYHLRPLRDVKIPSFCLFMKQSLQEKEENEWQDHLFSEGLSINLRNPSKEASVKARQGISMALSCHEITVSSSTDVMTNPLYDNNISIKKMVSKYQISSSQSVV